jgi:hypothetical protein
MSADRSILGSMGQTKASSGDASALAERREVVILAVILGMTTENKWQDFAMMPDIMTHIVYYSRLLNLQYNIRLETYVCNEAVFCPE